MTSHELARQLLAVPDCKVYVATDAEGNSFDTLGYAEQAQLERQGYAYELVDEGPLSWVIWP